MLAVTAAACMMPLMPYVRCGGMHDAAVDIVRWYRAGGQAGSASLAERPKPDAVPVGAYGERCGRVHAGGLGADWTVLELAAPVLPGLGVSTQKGPSSPTTE